MSHKLLQQRDPLTCSVEKINLGISLYCNLCFVLRIYEVFCTTDTSYSSTLYSVFVFWSNIFLKVVCCSTRTNTCLLSEMERDKWRVVGAFLFFVLRHEQQTSRHARLAGQKMGTAVLHRHSALHANEVEWGIGGGGAS